LILRATDLASISVLANEPSIGESLRSMHNIKVKKVAHSVADWYKV